MKNIKNFFISVALTLLMLLGLVGIVLWGGVLKDKFRGVDKISKTLAYAALDSTNRYDFLKTEIEKALFKESYKELETFADNYSLGYNITKNTGRPVAHFCPEGHTFDEIDINSDKYISYYTDGEGPYHIVIYIFYDVKETTIVDKLLAAIFFNPFLLFAGFAFFVAIFIVGLILLLTSASVLYKLWLLIIAVLSLELVLINPDGYNLPNALLIGMIIEKIIIGLVATFYIIEIARIRKGLNKINSNEYEGSPLNERTFPISLMPFAKDVNMSANNIATAVNEKMKSERLKTELISNVSHDIKTPLTSIINFSDLIFNEKSENPLITEYADHLHNQSIRMKEMMDALIEAAKASAGAVDIELVPCRISTLLDQCVIEYEEKLKARKITLITDEKDKDIVINADVSAISRIMDNLMVNIEKYGMPGSRAYVETERSKDKAVITVRNISADPLNISGDELTERFVRGDLSRHSEGHGLGLSIVKSLMDLMDAKFIISAKSDVFETKLVFDIVEK